MATGLREQKKRQTRERLMRAAVRLFLERGYDTTTVDAIAAEADVSPRTFFRYFPTKVDALFADLDERAQRIESALAERPPGELLVRTIRRVVTEFAGEFGADPALYLGRARLAFGDARIRPHALVRLGRMEDVLRRAVTADLGAADRDLGPRFLATASVAAIRASAETWIARDGRGDPRELVAEAFDLLERGWRSAERQR